jgi:hypothetical protein
MNFIGIFIDYIFLGTIAVILPLSLPVLLHMAFQYEKDIMKNNNDIMKNNNNFEQKKYKEISNLNFVKELNKIKNNIKQKPYNLEFELFKLWFNKEISVNTDKKNIVDDIY